MQIAWYSAELIILCLECPMRFVFTHVNPEMETGSKVPRIGREVPQTRS